MSDSPAKGRLAPCRYRSWGTFCSPHHLTSNHGENLDNNLGDCTHSSHNVPRRPQSPDFFGDNILFLIIHLTGRRYSPCCLTEVASEAYFCRRLWAINAIGLKLAAHRCLIHNDDDSLLVFLEDKKFHKATVSRVTVKAAKHSRLASVMPAEVRTNGVDIGDLNPLTTGLNGLGMSRKA